MGLFGKIKQKEPAIEYNSETHRAVVAEEKS